jgi:hypothetical protein
LESVGGGLELLPLPVEWGDEDAVFVDDLGEVLALCVAGQFVKLVDDLSQGRKGEFLTHRREVFACEAFGRIPGFGQYGGRLGGRGGA